MQFIKRFFNDPTQSFFLFGPRGTGKSTLVKALYKDALWIDLLNPETLRSYSARPERLFDLARATPEIKTIIIDEVQNVPSLLNVVHALNEEDKSIKFVLIGSSSRRLNHKRTNLLADRSKKFYKGSLA